MVNNSRYRYLTEETVFVSGNDAKVQKLPDKVNGTFVSYHYEVQYNGTVT